MSIKKSLLTITAAALAMMVFASTAMAVTEDKLVDVNTGVTIGANRDMHAVGWAKFVDVNGNGMECHVTSVVTTTGTAGTTGHVKSFTPDTTKCTGLGTVATFKGCNELTSDSTTNKNAGGAFNWDVTATTNDFDVSQEVSGEMVLHFKPKGTCLLQGTEITLTFPSITLRPLTTGSTGRGTGNLDRLSTTEAPTGQAIAGYDLSGAGTVHIGVNKMAVTASGELELTDEDRCTWKFAA